MRVGDCHVCVSLEEPCANGGDLPKPKLTAPTPRAFFGCLFDEWQDLKNTWFHFTVLVEITLLGECCTGQGSEEEEV